MAGPSLLPPTWEVPPAFRHRLGKTVGRQRAMQAEDHLLLILHAPPQPDDNGRRGRFFWRKPSGEWASSDLGNGPQALERHLDEYARLIERYDQAEEEAVDAEDYFQVVEGLTPVRRASRHLHQVLQDARKLVPTDRDLINLRDRSYEIERTAELLHEETRNSLDLLIARRAEEQAASSNRMATSAHRLNLLAAFFFPIATLSTVFGVNLMHGWEERSAPIPFLAMLAFGLALGFLLKSFVTHDSPSPAPRRAAEPRRRERGSDRTPQIERRPTPGDRRLARR